jgi:hypothetical protein
MLLAIPTDVRVSELTGLDCIDFTLGVGAVRGGAVLRGRRPSIVGED